MHRREDLADLRRKETNEFGFRILVFGFWIEDGSDTMHRVVTNRISNRSDTMHRVYKQKC
jgi:hypothetical protein